MALGIGSMKLRMVALVAALSSLTVACGSTAHEADGVAVEDGSSAGFEDASGAPLDGASVVPGAPGEAAPVDVPGLEGTDAGPGGGPGAAPGAQPGAPAPGGGAPAPGGPAKPRNTAPVRIGWISTDLTGMNAVMGGNSGAANEMNSDTNRAAERAEFAALVKWANDTGGVGGRPIQAIEFPVSISTVDEARAEAICIAAADDHKVQALIDRSYIPFDSTAQCLARKGVNFVSIHASMARRSLLDSVKPFTASNWPSLDRIGRVFVAGLREAGYFQNARVGVVMDDAPDLRKTYDADILPALRAAGVTPLEVAYLTSDSSNPASAEVANAVLRFRSQNVTHVLSLISLFNFVAFQQQAESSGYRPRYAFSDYGAGTSAAIGFGTKSQNANAIAVSVDPRAVVDSAASPRWSASANGGSSPPETRQNTTPGQRRCYDILSKYTGRDYYAGQGASISYRWYCDHFLLWLEAARKAGPDAGSRGWGNGLAALGESYLSSIVYRTQYHANRYDGASAYRVGKYDQGCLCFLGIGPWRSFGW